MKHTFPALAADHAGHHHKAAHLHMTTRVPVVRETDSLAHVRTLIEHEAADWETINYVYVVDSAHHLVGVLSVRDLFLHRSDALVQTVAKKTSLVTIHPDADQERAAYLALKHNIKSIPVVDEHGVFLGVVTNDTILGILQREMHEDALRRSGIRHPEAMNKTVLELSLTQSLTHRIPWLIVGMGGGILSAWLIGLFEATLQADVTLAVFIPLILYMSSAVGSQMQTYIIRDLALEHDIPFGRYFLKHLIVVLITAIGFGLSLAGISWLVDVHRNLSHILGLSLAAAISSSVITGLLVPYFFSRFKYDPADASGPIAMIVQDIMSVMIYLGIATLLL